MPADGFAAILIDRRLRRRERRAALAHELVHHEQGGGCDHPDMPTSWHPVVCRHEARVASIAAERLIPLEHLVELIDRLAELGEHVTTARVADEFDEAEWVAERALQLLGERLGRP